MISFKILFSLLFAFIVLSYSQTTAVTSLNDLSPAQVLEIQLKTAPTEVDRISLLEPSQFVFDFTSLAQQLNATGVVTGEGGQTVEAVPTNFPALIGHGVAMTVGFIEPCGINLPHTHPRATEINFIVSGQFRAGFFLENGAKFIGNTLSPGMMTIFPQGAIHFEQNIGCTPAMFVAAFNNEDPGVQTTTLSYFGLPSDIASIGLDISIDEVQQLADNLAKNPALGILECRQRCGLLNVNTNGDLNATVPTQPSTPLSPATPASPSTTASSSPSSPSSSSSSTGTLPPATTTASSSPSSPSSTTGSSSSGSVVVSLTSTAQWNDSSNYNSQFSVNIQNTGSNVLSSTQIVINFAAGSITSYWNMTPVDNSNSQWEVSLFNLQAGQTSTSAGFIWSVSLNQVDNLSAPSVST